MKLDIPYYIRQVLREQRMVSIPGIGTFRLNQSPSQFNDDKTELHPPSLDISFDDEDTEDDSLMRYILDTGLYSEEKIKKKITQYTQSVFNNLLNVDSFRVEGIGTILKNEDLDKVKFESNISEFTREFGDLPLLNLTPIARIVEEQPVALASESTPQIKESGSFLPRILLLAALIVALWFLGRFIKNTYFNQAEADKKEVVEPAQTEDKAAIDEESRKELEQKYEEIDELIDPNKSKEEAKDTENGKDEKSSDSDEAGTETKISDNDLASVDQPVKIEEAIEEPDSKSTVVEEAEEKSSNKHADIIPESGECIIIVGSFIKSLNAIKMASLLERKGYEVYQSEYKGFKRVGLKYECIDEDLEEYLHDIRKKISKKAWYLAPSLDVPYRKK